MLGMGGGGCVCMCLCVKGVCVCGDPEKDKKIRKLKKVGVFLCVGGGDEQVGRGGRRGIHGCVCVYEGEKCIGVCVCVSLYVCAVMKCFVWK